MVGSLSTMNKLDDENASRRLNDFSDDKNFSSPNELGVRDKIISNQAINELTHYKKFSFSL